MHFASTSRHAGPTGRSEHLGDDPTRWSIVALGAEIARLHLHGRSFHSTEGLRPWDTPFPHGERSLLGRTNADLVEGSWKATFERAARAARRALELLRDDGPPRVIHCDLHQDNVLISNGEIALIDFDDCMRGWPVQDLGVTMWEVGEDEIGCRTARRSGNATNVSHLGRNAGGVRSTRSQPTAGCSKPTTSSGSGPIETTTRSAMHCDVTLVRSAGSRSVLAHNERPAGRATSAVSVGSRRTGSMGSATPSTAGRRSRQCWHGASGRMRHALPANANGRATRARPFGRAEAACF
jgi:hypothetical protein